MSSIKLIPASAIESFVLPPLDDGAVPGVVMSERAEVSLYSVLARKCASRELAERVGQEFGLRLPRSPRYTGPGPVAFIWAGPDQWLAMADCNESRTLGDRLRSSLADVASVIDQSDGRVVIRVGGPRVRNALAKGVHIDLHSSAFTIGDTAITTVAYINVQFWQVNASPTYEFAMFRSFALAFYEWFADAAAEYGVAAI